MKKSEYIEFLQDKISKLEAKVAALEIDSADLSRQVEEYAAEYGDLVEEVEDRPVLALDDNLVEELLEGSRHIRPSASSSAFVLLYKMCECTEAEKE